MTPAQQVEALDAENRQFLQTNAQLEALDAENRQFLQTNAQQAATAPGAFSLASAGSGSAYLSAGTPSSVASTPSSVASTPSSVEAPAQPTQKELEAKLGLLNTPSTQGYTSTPTTSSSYNATTGTVAEPELVQSIIGKVLSRDSPLIRDAVRRSNEDYNSRGLLNSSQAIGAGAQAAIESALPIAQQDAGAYTSLREANLRAQNEASAANALARNQALSQSSAAANAAAQQKSQNQSAVDMASIQALTTMQATYVDTENAVRLANIDQDTAIAVANLDTTTKIFVSELDAKNRQLIQTNASAAAIFEEAMANLASIAADDNMGQAAKANATNSQLATLSSALSLFEQVAATDAFDIDSLDLGSVIEPLEETAKAAEENRISWEEKMRYNEKNLGSNGYWDSTGAWREGVNPASPPQQSSQQAGPSSGGGNPTYDNDYWVA